MSSPVPRAASLLLLVLTGCPLLQVEAEVPEVCIARAGIAAAASAGQRQLLISVTLDDLAALQDVLDDDDQLRFTRFTAWPQGAVDDFAFVDDAQIAVVTDTQAPLRVFACQGACAQPDGSLQLVAASADNAVPYLRAAQLAVEVTLTGELPTQEWALDAEVCLSGALTRSVGP